jgi:hypothetical protein
MKWIKFDKDDESTWPDDNTVLTAYHYGGDSWEYRTAYFDSEDEEWYSNNNGSWWQRVHYYMIPEPPKR